MKYCGDLFFSIWNIGNIRKSHYVWMNDYGMFTRMWLCITPSEEFWEFTWSRHMHDPASVSCFILSFPVRYGKFFLLPYPQHFTIALRKCLLRKPLSDSVIHSILLLMSEVYVTAIGSVLFNYDVLLDI